ncbi:MAG: uroporphyrinogen-III C-methyltransferase [Acidimicrobiales bacterium]|nr:uroporphyrinogen-III C-methyltransferase [Acidimicrobiales bacterium]
MTVYLVGAGPGDPGLLTLRGAEVLRLADVVVHDRLSAVELLELAPDTAERIDVGKAPRHHRMTQDDINALLVERGLTGQTVVRLKGGDPFVFARGSEEAHALAAAGVPYEVVPGITSALAVPAYGGIPVTQRFSSTSFTVVTGHEDPSSGDGTVDWGAVANTGGTLVILMGVGRWPQIAERLLAAGRSPETPAAAVRWGSRPNQHTVRATLATLADHPLEAPSVIVVGQVAAEDLNWFEGRPLFGRTVVVTRARAQASAFAHELRSLGASVIEAPTIEVVDPSDGGAALRAAVDELSSGTGAYDWLVVTSVNGVERTFDHLPDARVLAGVRVAAVGTATAEALAARRIVADLVPERFVAEGLIEAFPAPPPEGGRVLLARAEVARTELPDALRAMGWEVHDVAAYRTAPAAVADDVAERIAAADAVTFTSSSTVTNLVAAVGADRVPPVVASIGPVTTATARKLGLEVTVEATPHTTEALLAALVEALPPAVP